MLISLKSILNYTINATDGMIGRIRDIYFYDDSWFVKFFVVEIGTIFRSHKVLIPPAQSDRVDHMEKTVNVELNKDDIRQSPKAILHKPVSVALKEQFTAYNKKLHLRGYHGATVDNIVSFPSFQTDPNLRSVREVIGYHVQSFSGPAGRLLDLSAYEEGWNIRYLVIGINRFFHNRKVMIAPQMAQRIIWEGKRIEIEAGSDEIYNSPERDNN
ncbi:MAG: hypothetical protein BWY28_01774 [bacterium ADurb.Bin236]|nr:MAG: hypothetical protein BWY28_01774 [bacterium ADurb.Bin236]